MISIIIPAHNEKQNLDKLLPYLQELIKVDDTEILISISASNSDCTAFEQLNSKIIFYKCPTNGRAIQMNYAANKAKGDILVFLHADVIPPINFIEDIKATINNKYEAGFFSYKFDKESFFLNINSSFTAKDGIFTGGGDQCLFIKKDVFFQLGKFNEAQVIMEDFEFFKRMKKEKVNYKIIKNNLIVSARKYETNSYLKVNISNLVMVVLFNLGYPANKLKSLHSKLLKMPYSTK